MTLDQFLPFVLIELQGCPEPLIKQALLRSAEEFCRRTNAWSEVQEPIRLQAGVRDYDLEAPSGALVCAVLDVFVGGRKLHPGDRGQLRQQMSAWLAGAGPEPRFYSLLIDRSLLSLYPTPDEQVDAEMVIRAAYAPTTDAASLPDFLGQRYLNAITSGAKAILMAVPNKPWSNPPLVVYHRNTFDSAMTEAAAEELHGRTIGSVSLAPRRFGSWG